MFAALFCTSLFFYHLLVLFIKFVTLCFSIIKIQSTRFIKNCDTNLKETQQFWMCKQGTIPRVCVFRCFMENLTRAWVTFWGYCYCHGYIPQFSPTRRAEPHRLTYTHWGKFQGAFLSTHFFKNHISLLTGAFSRLHPGFPRKPTDGLHRTLATWSKPSLVACVWTLSFAWTCEETPGEGMFCSLMHLTSLKKQRSLRSKWCVVGKHSS